jgi:hypothetical protein
MYAGTGIPMGMKSLFTETEMGMGKIFPHGDGDGGLFPDGEFPVTIFNVG